MLLVVDAGNTNIVFALFDGERNAGTWRIATNPRRTADEYAAWLLTLCAADGVALGAVDRAIIATVVPEALYHLRQLCRRWCRVEPLVVSAALDWGFDIRVDTPTEVGADRLVNALAAHHRYRGPLVVVDFGTATTFDVVDGEGNYHGGAIAPGINLSIEALHQAAARLPRIAIGRPATAIGRSTIAAMRAGIYWGYVGLLEGIIGRIRREFGGPMKVVATGGLAPLFSSASETLETIDPDLTLDGLRLLSERNRTGPRPVSLPAETHDGRQA